MSNLNVTLSRRAFGASAAFAAATILGAGVIPALAAEKADGEAAGSAAADEAEATTSGMTLEQLQAEAIPQASKAGEDTPETRGEVDATRTYTLQNATDETITELYIYETPAEGEEVAEDAKGKNLAGDGLERGEQVSVTLTGRYLHTENETLFTCEYACGGATYFHPTMHVEDLLFDKVIYLVAADGVSGATALSFGESNLPEGVKLADLEDEAITQASKAGEDTPETRGEVDATRTYTLQNACDDVITELYIYETPADGEEVAPEAKGKNLAGDGMERGEQVSPTFTGRYLHTDEETLFTCEYVAGGTTYYHKTMHVEDLLFDKVIYLVAADGVSGATAVSFGDSNL